MFSSYFPISRRMVIVEKRRAEKKAKEEVLAEQTKSNRKAKQKAKQKDATVDSVKNSKGNKVGQVQYAWKHTAVILILSILLYSASMVNYQTFHFS